MLYAGLKTGMSTLWPETGETEQWLMAGQARVTSTDLVTKNDSTETTWWLLEFLARIVKALARFELFTKENFGTNSHMKTVHSVMVLERETALPDNNDCPECLGCGIIDLSTVACPVCKGTGKVAKNDTHWRMQLHYHGRSLFVQIEWKLEHPCGWPLSILGPASFDWVLICHTLSGCSCKTYTILCTQFIIT